MDIFIYFYLIFGIVAYVFDQIHVNDNICESFITIILIGNIIIAIRVIAAMVILLVNEYHDISANFNTSDE